ncbi:hypothetical protein [Trujillonella endophytica]|uniref:Uncharacterized protein n=1 Tax=Trujillonella endophytica TaxID=673521 RepID=A0A1H8RR86_9ACTN|nr:hypothetical protein [Trujillella endophytica]SEO68787.1 hypothetical protein SAMN05660991_01276 [Trujillella endophytica]
MTSSQPPQQPGYGQQPPAGQPYGQPQPQPGYGQNPYGQPVGNGGQVGFDAKRLKLADFVVAGAALVWLVLSFFPWIDVDAEEVFGPGYSEFAGDYSENFSAWNIGGALSTLAALCLVAAAVWALLPAVTQVAVPFPRAYVTVALTALATIFTLILWIDAQDWEFSFIGLIALLVALAATAFAVLRLLPELKNRPGLPGGLANATQWANQQAPAFGPGQAPGQQYGQQPPPPPAQPGHPTGGF